MAVKECSKIRVEEKEERGRGVEKKEGRGKERDGECCEEKV